MLSHTRRPVIDSVLSALALAAFAIFVLIVAEYIGPATVPPPAPPTAHDIEQRQLDAQTAALLRDMGIDPTEVPR